MSDVFYLCFFFNANTELTTDDIVSEFKARSNKTQLNANVFTYTHRHGRIRMVWYSEKVNELTTIEVVE